MKKLLNIKTKNTANIQEPVEPNDANIYTKLAKERLATGSNNFKTDRFQKIKKIFVPKGK